mmetsp:Transcript_16690/g.48447  ORF Transcript_16690/g.48447 Transcript_16690/m.48447 type:complete len:206 (-) Transcript_16690:800-1417(-)
MEDSGINPPTFKGFNVGTNSCFTMSGSVGTSTMRSPPAFFTKSRTPSAKARASQQAPVLVSPLKKSLAVRPKATLRTKGAPSWAISDQIKLSSAPCIVAGGGGNCASRSAAPASSREQRSSRRSMRNASRSNSAVAGFCAACGVHAWEPQPSHEFHAPCGLQVLDRMTAGCSSAARCATSVSFIGPSMRFGRWSFQPSARKSRTS